MASFNSVVAVVEAAIAIQRTLDCRFHPDGAEGRLALRVRISAREPVTDGHDDLFGAAVQFPRRLCDNAQPSAIAVPLAVRELCIGKSIHFEGRGSLPLKDFSEPVHTYEVTWRA